MSQGLLFQHMSLVGEAGPRVISSVYKQLPQITAHWESENLRDGRKAPPTQSTTSLRSLPDRGHLALTLNIPGESMERG